LLRKLGALDAQARITAHGRDMLKLGEHPRLAHMLLLGLDAGAAASACALAALLTERDILRSRDADITTRLEALVSGSSELDRSAVSRVRRSIDFHARQLGGKTRGHSDPGTAGWLLALAYPDRVGRARGPGAGRYQLSNGRGAFFAEAQAMAKSEFIVVATLDGGERDARIFLAAPISLSDIRQWLGPDLLSVDRVGWDPREEAVVARREERLGELVIADGALPALSDGARAAAMLAGIRQIGLGALPWTAGTRSWQARVMLLRRAEPQAMEPWPDVSDEALLASLEHWLAPFLGRASRRQHLAGIDLAAALASLLSWAQRKRLDEWAPTHLNVPSGSSVPIDYLDGATPALSVRLQEVFGLAETPRIAGGRIPLTMKLLSPARRPVQVTQDLSSFWERGYHEVRKELKGRYPKHYWPEDPHQAEPTRRLRPK
jgi:ATP-dependent helicase HrpB